MWKKLQMLLLILVGVIVVIFIGLVVVVTRKPPAPHMLLVFIGYTNAPGQGELSMFSLANLSHFRVGAVHPVFEAQDPAAPGGVKEFSGNTPPDRWRARMEPGDLHTFYRPLPQLQPLSAPWRLTLIAQTDIGPLWRAKHLVTRLFESAGVPAPYTAYYFYPIHSDWSTELPTNRPAADAEPALRKE